MNKLLLLLIGIWTFTAAYAQTAPTVYVAGDGTGDFNCDGIADQVEINQALDFVAAHAGFTTVYLKGPHTYYIDEPVFISSNTVLTGDSTAKIELKPHAGWWTRDKPLIAQKGRITQWNPWGDDGDDISNVEIYGFEISGGLLQDEPSGSRYIPLIHFCYPHNVKIHDMHLHDSRWDIIRMTSSGGPGGDTQQDCDDCKIYNNLIEYSGHEGICFVGLYNFEVYNNRIYSTRTNCGIRCKETDDFDLHDNIIGNAIAKYSSGYAGILIENQITPLTRHAEIYNNVIYGKNGGIHLGNDAQAGNTAYPFGTRINVHIHHNKIYKIKDQTVHSGNGDFVLEGGISIAGYDHTLIEHNVIDGCTTDGIIFSPRLADGTGYQTIVRNNIIMNVADTALNNRAPGVNTFLSDNNLFFNNGVNYGHAGSTTDLDADPLFAGSHSTLGQWHHIVATYSNITETIRIYVDGRENISRTLPGFGAMAVNSDNLLVGMEGAYAYTGRMDELAIWNRALSASEVGDLYHNGSPVPVAGPLTAGLQVYLPMDQSWDDASGHHFDALQSTAGFTSEALVGSHAGLFDGQSYVQYPSNLSTAQGISISLWVYRTDLTGDYQPLVSKGDASSVRSFNLYFKEESIEFDVGDGTYITTLQGNVLNPWDIDYHPQSEAGHWNGTAWLNDTITSPCVDGGYVSSDYSNEPAPNGGRVNIGVYGNTPEASKSPATAIQSIADRGWTLYPNPAGAEIIVNGYPENTRYQILSLTGTVVKSGNLSRGRVNVSGLHAGIYLFRITDPHTGHTAVAKIVKK